MLFGQRAFRRDTSAETMTAILKEDPPELSLTGKPISPALERIVRRCLEKNPQQRFQSARDLAFNLEGLSGTSSTSAGTALPGLQLQRPKRKSSGRAGDDACGRRDFAELVAAGSWMLGARSSSATAADLSSADV